MLKKILLTLLLLVIVIPAAGIAWLYLRKPAQAPPSTIKVSMTPERIARGKYLFENLADFSELPDRGFDVIALPMKIAGGSGGPLRIMAVIPH